MMVLKLFVYLRIISKILEKIKKLTFLNLNIDQTYMRLRSPDQRVLGPPIIHMMRLRPAGHFNLNFD